MIRTAVSLSSGRLFFNPCYQSSTLCTRLYCITTSSSSSNLHPATANRIADQPSFHNDNLLDFFDHLLLHQTTNIHHLRQIHTRIVLSALSPSPFLSARLISIYSKFDHLKEAQKIFENIAHGSVSNMLLWNSILRAYTTHGKYNQALELYLKMRRFGLSADGFSYPLIIRACVMTGDVKLCDVVHCHVVQMGFQNHVHVCNELLGSYAKAGRMNVAKQVFDRMSVRTMISWNFMVSGFALNFDCEGALHMFSRMESEGCKPNPVTWTSLLSGFAKCGRHEDVWQYYCLMRQREVEATAELLAVVLSVCANSSALNKGEMIHGYAVKGGFGKYLVIENSLISVYGKSGAVKEAEYIFSGLESKTIVSWNSLISTYVDSGLCDEAFELFSQLETSEGNAKVKPNVVTWSAIISGFAARGRHEKSLKLFRSMQLARVVENSVTICSILTVCAEISAPLLGREIHAHVVRHLMDKNILVKNGLLNMYMKCGSMKEALLLFEGMDDSDLFSWNTMIAGYGMHGFAEESLRTFNQMINAGFKPDEVTFIAILSACSHGGLITEGRKLFDCMSAEFNIEPQVEHYACMVDLLGRAGLLHEASDVVKSMPVEPNACVWGALLHACRMHKNTDVAEDTAAQIFNLNSAMTGSSYMLLSNLYAASGRYQDSARVRLLAKTRGLKKIAGESWIEVKKKVHVFSAEKACLQTEVEELYAVLRHLRLQMEIDCYVPKGATDEGEYFAVSDWEKENNFQDMIV